MLANVAIRLGTESREIYKPKSGIPECHRVLIPHLPTLLWTRSFRAALLIQFRPNQTLRAAKILLVAIMKSWLGVSTFAAIYLVEAVAGAVTTVRMGTGPCAPSVTPISNPTASFVSSTSSGSQSPWVLVPGLSEFLFSFGWLSYWAYRVPMRKRCPSWWRLVALFLRAVEAAGRPT